MSRKDYGDPITVGLVKDHPELQEIISRRDEFSTMAKQKKDFLEKQAENLMEENERNAKAYWNDVADYLERQELTPKGFKLNSTHAISLQNGAISFYPETKKTKEEGHGPRCDCGLCDLIKGVLNKL